MPKDPLTHIDKMFNFKPRWFNRKGKPISVDEAELLLIDPNYKILKQDRIGDYFVSTVWLGLNMNHFDFEGKDTPLIFETMVFKYSKDGVSSADDLFMDRYCSEEEAFNGHEKVCEMARIGKFED